MVRHASLRLSPASILAMVVCAGLLAALCVLVVPAIPAGAAGTSQGPVAEYSFDEDPGESGTVEDVSGDGNTATIEGAEWAPGGKYGGAMRFDAAKEDRLSVPASEDLNLENEFTLEAWVRPETEAEEYALILGKENSVSPHFAYVLYAQTPQNRAKVFFAEGAPGHLEAEGGSPAPRTWTHIAVTDDGAHSRLYINGKLVDTAEAISIPSTDGDLVIGGNKAFAAFFDGKIDEVRVYNRPLAEGEIQADAATPIETPRQGPVAEYSFDEDPGESGTVEDLTGDGNTATVEGAEWAPHGRYGGAYKFDAAEGDVLTVPAAEDLDLTEEFTVEAWIKPESTPEFANILEKENSGEPSYGYLLTDHHDQLGAYFQEEPSYSLFSPGEVIEPHTWNHVALTYDGSRVHLFLNGVQVAAGPAPSFLSTDGALKIGGGEGGPYGGNDFDGRIDEVRIYARALDEGEVQADAGTPIQTPRSGPIAAYAFDEGTGETVADVSGHGHTATIEGEAKWAKGKYGGALSFLKEGDCASVADSPELRLTEEFTIEAWVRPDGGIYEDPVVVREAGGEDVFGLGIGSSEEGHAEAFIGEGGEAETAVGGKEIREYEWVHLAATWDGAHIRLYVDGELAATEATTTPPGGGEGGLRIGCDTPEGPFGGRIDEVRVYDRALDGAEVGSDMETPLQTPKATPVARYSFDENNEETAEDLSGDGHTATVEGAKWTEHGRYGGAYEFDAEEEDILKIPASPELNFDEEFTLEAWVRPSGDENKDAPLIDKQEGSGLGYFVYEGGTVSDRPVGAAEEGQEHVHADDPLPAHAWSHVALSFTGNRTYLYVDGELVDNGAAEPVVTSEGELEIGGSTDTGEYFDGRIDEVRVYNRALDTAEVGADMEAPIQTPQLGPVAAYSFEEGTGSTVEDQSGDGNTATIEGAEWTTHGKYGGALQFNGTSSCVSIADTAELRLGEEFTLESWIRPEGELEDDPVIFKEGSGHLNYALGVGQASTGMAEGAIGTSGSPHRKAATATEALNADVWNHLAVTFDGSALRLYVNGALVDAEAVEGADSGREGALKIGCDSQYGEHFKGRIDEVRIYDRALTAGEVAQDLGVQGMAATYVLEEEEEAIQAEAISFYPETANGAPSGPAFVRTRVTLFGAPTEAGGSPLASAGAKMKPYQFAECSYSHHEPGVVAGKTAGPSRGVLMEFALAAAKDTQKAAKTTKPHGLPKCDGTLEPNYFHFQWGDEIWGDFFYEPNKKVWIEEAPQCEAWAPEQVELEWAEYEQKVKEHRNPHKPKRQDAKPKEEVCFAPHRESTEVPGGIDVVSRVSWTPAFLFRGGGTEREKVCGTWEGHLTANPPNFQNNGLRQVYKSHHLHWFYEGKGLKCDWGNPGGDIKSE